MDANLQHVQQPPSRQQVQHLPGRPAQPVLRPHHAPHGRPPGHHHLQGLEGLPDHP